MLLKALHRLASHGWVYDLIQTLLGVKIVHRRFRTVLGTSPYDTVLDIGGGTGRIRPLLSRDCRYFCLDNEPAKLLQFRGRVADGLAILGDATALPAASGSIDLVLCIAVTHHLTDSGFEQMLRDAARALRPGGRLLLYDALRKPERWASRLLWALDRGSNPRSKEAILNAVAKQLRVVRSDELRVWHEYLFLMATKDT